MVVDAVMGIVVVPVYGIIGPAAPGVVDTVVVEIIMP